MAAHVFSIGKADRRNLGLLGQANQQAEDTTERSYLRQGRGKNKVKPEPT